METLGVYRYRAIRMRYGDACRQYGIESTQARKIFSEAFKFREGLTEDERQVTERDLDFTMILVDVDVNTHKGWPVRVWERERPAKPVSLRDLADWTDWDGAEYILACSLGILQGGDSFSAAKHLFWTNNPLGEGLAKMLMSLVDIGILQHREEPDRQFRWNDNFKTGDRK